MGFTPLFELFAGPLSLHLNPVSALGGVIPAKNPKGVDDQLTRV